MAPGAAPGEATDDGAGKASSIFAGVAAAAPTISLPGGSPAIRGIDERLTTNPFTGTASLAVPIATSPGRGGVAIELGLTYDSRTGNGPFGVGWHQQVPAITRNTDKRLPRYMDAEESDVFMLSGADDLVPTPEVSLRDGYRVRGYRPRVEGLFARIERWTAEPTGDSHFRVVTRDNRTNIYGRSAAARVADPAAPARVYSWLLDETRDDHGGAVRYTYKAEDGAGVERAQSSEASRFDRASSGTRFLATAQRYLKRVHHGNRMPLADHEPAPADPSAWLFEVVFDYGEHDRDTPTPDDDRDRPWPVRADPQSSFRAGFEVRTYRLCRRVLTFHRFAELGDTPCLVRSTDFAYDESLALTYLTRVEHAGYTRRPGTTSYTRAALPALDLDYTRTTDLDDTAHTFDGANLAGIADGVADPSRPHDREGNGIAGVSHADDRDDPFTPLRSVASIDWSDPDLRTIDLDGDGLPDVLITENDALVWYRSLAEIGFESAVRMRRLLDADNGPTVVFADGAGSIYLADMTGDGLVDIVRVRNGEVCYWPNLGHGRFGPKITMGTSPVFDRSDLFDPRRVRFSDIDGSGPSDILYLGRDGIAIYLNQAGNGFSGPRMIRSLPTGDALASTTVADLRGRGTTCLVWSSPAPAPGRASRPVAYVDLLGGITPHLLTSIKNNLGAEIQISYASSTQFYRADKVAGAPWSTRLPFPVHVVERVTTYDRINRSRFVTRYTYHHGYYDGVERAFRGFGRVDQLDTEEIGALTASGELPAGDNLDAASHAPPVLTRTWFHTGAFADGGHIPQRFEAEYHAEPGLTDPERRTMLLDDTVLPDGLSAGDAREACRALKGSMLCREVYAHDGSEAEGRPYLASERNYTIVAVQPRSSGRPGVFFVHPREAIERHYERKLYQVGDRRLADPRVRHTLTLAVDDFGHVLRAVDIAYGRRHASPDPVLTDIDRSRQSESHVTWTENAYSNAVDQDSAYRAPLPCETRHYEITRLLPSASRAGAARRFGFGEIEQALDVLEDGGHDLAAEDLAGAGATQAGPYRRLIGHARTLYRRDDLTGPLAPGRIESRALPYESYQLALTPGLVAAVYGDRVTDAMLASDGGYVHVDGDADWWIPTGRVFYGPRSDDSPAEELDHARRHFFVPRRFCDPFGQTTQVTYDRYDLLVWQTRDPIGNVVTAGAHDAAGTLIENGNDYRVLQPARIMDPNRNSRAVAFDALGMVVGTAVMGKPEEQLGDSLDRFEADLYDGAIAAHLADPLADPHSLLGAATTRLVYDRFAYQRTQTDPRPEPPVVYTLSRETHEADLVAGQRTSVQHRLSYSDGAGRVIQHKVQAEPGPVTPGGPTVNPRWIGSGSTIFNHKGNPVRTYEPFFTDSHRFESAKPHGNSSVTFYDPLARVVATLHPEHTYERVAFDPWHQASWDVNDNVLRADPRSDPDVGAWLARLPTDEYLPTWYEQRNTGALGDDERDAATKAAAHAGTPGVAHVDALGRRFLTVAHNRFEHAGLVVEDEYRTSVILDIVGNRRAVIDAEDRVAMRYDHDLLGHRIHQASMEAGERWMLGDAAGKPIRDWDSRGCVRRTTYDQLRRPIGLYVTEGGAERLAERTVYGETKGDADNHRGQIFQRFDAAGIVTSVRYDFKGNLQHRRRELLAGYKQAVNWLLEPGATDGSFTSRTSYDALNRPLAVTSPDGSVYLPSFNEANLLERVDVQIRGALIVTPLITDIAYDAGGRHVQIDYANGARSRYVYDPCNSRLTRIVTARDDDDDDTIASELFRDCDAIQDLRYTYDPAGNIVRCEDAALVVVIRDGQRIDPVGAYTYDAVYRLIEARGREHIAQTALELVPPDGNYRDHPFAGIPTHPDDLQALCNYTERYDYDLVGNVARLSHRANGTGWTRRYDHQATSLLESDKTSDRLTGTTVGQGLDLVESYGHDSHGNMTSMPHLPALTWNFKDELVRADLDGGGAAYYVYDAAGQRVRKVIESEAGVRQHERLYLDGFELYREYSGAGDAIVLERESLHVIDGVRRIALIEILTVQSGTRIVDPDPVQRYQLDNHLGSASIELDGAGAVLSYEEYHPYGTTSFQAAQPTAGASRKRYRYRGEERDEETGFGYHGARYYAPHLGRWISNDPTGSRYNDVRCDPILQFDPQGTLTKDR